MTHTYVPAEFRGARNKLRMENPPKTLEKLQRAIPLYYAWYMRNRGSSLPRGWIVQHFHELDRDIIRYDPSAERCLARFATNRQKSLFYNDKFRLLRDLLADGIIEERANTARMGTAGTCNRDRMQTYTEERRDDEEKEIQDFVTRAVTNERHKEEQKASRDSFLALCVQTCEEDIFTRYPDMEDPSKHLLYERTAFPPSDSPGRADALPFGAKTIDEAIRIGASTNKHFHFNFCVRIWILNRE